MGWAKGLAQLTLSLAQPNDHVNFVTCRTWINIHVLYILLSKHASYGWKKEKRGYLGRKCWLVVVAERFGMRVVVVEELTIREITSAPIIGLEKQLIYYCCWSRMK